MPMRDHLCSGLNVSIISLPDQLARRQSLLAKGFPDKWISGYLEATDFRSLSYQELPKYCHVNEVEACIKRKLTPGEVGCALSHLEAMKRQVESKQPLLLILEDDIVPLHDGFIRQLNQIWSELEALNPARQAFVANLGLPEDQVEQILSRLIFSKKGWSLKKSPSFRAFCDPVHRIYRAHSYIISLATSRRIVSSFTKVRMLADDWIFMKENGLVDHLLISSSQVFSQDSTFASTILGRDSYSNLFEAGDPKNNGNVKINRGLVVITKVFNSIPFRAKKIYRKTLSKLPLIIS